MRLSDVARDALFVVDRHGRISEHNTAFATLAAQLAPGVSLAGASLGALLPLHALEVMSSALAEARRTGLARPVLARTGPNFETYEVELRCEPGSEDVLGAMRSAASAPAIVAPEAYYGALVDNATDIVSIVDRELRFVAWNRVFAASARGLLGRELVEGDEMLPLVVPDQRTSFRRLIERTFEGEAIIHVFDVLLENGLRRQYETSFNVARPRPGAEHVVIVARNVTGARAEVEALHRVAEQRRNLLEAFPDAITVLRPDGTITEYHPAEDVPMPVDLSAVIGRNLMSFDHLAPEELMSRLTAAFATGETQVFEYDAMVDGVIRRREGRIRAVGNDEALLIVRDLTEGRELTKRLVTSDRMAALGTLAAGVAHELNNPLMYMSAHIENLRDGLAPDAAREALDAASEGVERMSSIVRELTAYGRESSSAGAVADVAAALDFAERITRRSLAPQARIVRGPDAGLLVAIGEARLGQVLVNLLLNAGDAIGDAGRRARGEIRTSVSSTDDTVTIEVKDDGAGMAEDVARRVFDPFFTTKAPGRGSGLGLWVSLGIVRDAGGDIDVESSAGGGTSFRVTLPRVRGLVHSDVPAPPTTVARR